MIRKSFSIAACWMALAALFALNPSAAMAECQTWQWLRKFNAVQANGYNVVFELSGVANGNATGSAHYYAGSDFRRYEGKADARFDGKSINISVWWPHNKALGEYKGHIDSGGNLAGVTQDLQKGSGAPNPEVYWSSKQKFKCAQVTAAPDNRYCDAYAQAAVAETKESLQLDCGFTGARWSAEVGGHFNWCVALGGDHTQPNSEKAARAAQLSDCRAKVAARRQIITKPQGGVGDILKQMEP